MAVAIRLRRFSPPAISRLITGFAAAPTSTMDRRRRSCYMLRRLGLSVRAAEAVELLLGLLFGVAVALLKFADELILLAGDHREIVVRKFAPFCLHSALELLPIAFYLIPIHDRPPFGRFFGARQIRLPSETKQIACPR